MRLFVMVVMLSIPLSFASSSEIHLSESCNTASGRSLLQASAVPALPAAGGILPEEVFASILDSSFPVSSVNSNLEVDISQAIPEGELSRAKKAAFVALSGAFIVGVSLYIKKLIDDYEEAGNVSTPPWYVDSHMLFKISCITLFSWLSLGVLAFTQVLLFNSPPRHLSFVESLYLSAQIVTTVGYGDLTPAKPEGQLFLACYILMGLTMVALVVAQLTERLLNAGLGSSHGNTKDSAHSAQHYEPSPQFRVIRSIFLFFLAAVTGTVFYCLYPGEGKTIWQAFYMSCVTLTTVGFGAIRPETEGGYLFAIFWMLIGVSCTANMVCTIGDSLMKHRRDLTGQLLKDEMIREMDADGSGKVDKIEFLRFELARKGICHKSNVDDVLSLFDRLDSDRSGQLDIEDLKAIA